MTTGWDGFARRRRHFFFVPLCALWDPAVRILRFHFKRDEMGPLGLYVGWGWDGKLGRPSSMETARESTKTEMGWDGMRLMCHTGGGTPLGLCHWQCGIVREIQYGTTRPQQQTPQEKQTMYGNYLQVVVVFCILQG